MVLDVFKRRFWSKAYLGSFRREKIQTLDKEWDWSIPLKNGVRTSPMVQILDLFIFILLVPKMSKRDKI